MYYTEYYTEYDTATRASSVASPAEPRLRSVATHGRRAGTPAGGRALVLRRPCASVSAPRRNTRLHWKTKLHQKKHRVPTHPPRLFKRPPISPSRRGSCSTLSVHAPPPRKERLKQVDQFMLLPETSSTRSIHRPTKGTTGPAPAPPERVTGGRLAFNAVISEHGSVRTARSPNVVSDRSVRSDARSPYRSFLLLVVRPGAYI